MFLVYLKNKPVVDQVITLLSVMSNGDTPVTDEVVNLIFKDYLTYQRSVTDNPNTWDRTSIHIGGYMYNYAHAPDEDFDTGLTTIMDNYMCHIKRTSSIDTLPLKVNSTDGIVTVTYE